MKPSTYSNYKYNVQKYLIPEYKNKKLKKLEKIDFNEYIDKLKKKKSSKTVRDIVANLKAILYYAEDKYDCNLKIKKIKTPKVKTKQLTILTKKEVRNLERVCRKENTLVAFGIMVCLNTGLRIGEISALRWKNIDLDRREIRVKNTMQRIYLEDENYKTGVVIGTPKSQTSERSIPISDKLYEIFKSIKKRNYEEEFFLTGNCTRSIEPRTLRYNFKLLLKKYKMKTSYKFHILRHTFATNCIEIGMDPKTLSELLGHSTVEMTLNKYVHSSYRIKKRYLDKL